LGVGSDCDISPLDRPSGWPGLRERNASDKDQTEGAPSPNKKLLCGI
jgi:hypothetical protein